MAGARMRQLRGMEIVSRTGQIKRMSDSKYLVRSQHQKQNWYPVEWIKGKWKCHCPDFVDSGESCKHIYAITFLLKLPHIVFLNLNYDLLTCPRCSADPEMLVSIGNRKNKCGATRRFRCKKCGYESTDRTGFAKMRTNPTFIVVALDLFFGGFSTRQITHHLSSVYAAEVSQMTICRWLKKYVSLISSYVSRELKPILGTTWHADEMVIAAEGAGSYLWNVADRKTRYLIVSTLTTARGEEEAYAALNAAIQHGSSVKVNTLFTDALKSYTKAARRAKIPNHVARCRLKDVDHNNNRIERLNETLRARYRTLRGLKQVQSSFTITDGLRLYYDFIRPHMSLEGNTPSDSAKIQLKGRNRWLSLTIGASKSRKAQ